jgi:hypothetical protein
MHPLLQAMTAAVCSGELGLQWRMHSVLLSLISLNLELHVSVGDHSCSSCIMHNHMLDLC